MSAVQEVFGEWVRRHQDEWSERGYGPSARGYAYTVAAQRTGGRKSLSYGYMVGREESRRLIRGQVDAIVAERAGRHLSKKYLVTAVVPVWAESAAEAGRKLAEHASSAKGIRPGAVLDARPAEDGEPGLAEALAIARDRLDNDADAYADEDIVGMLVDAVEGLALVDDDLDPAWSTSTRERNE